MSDYPSGLTRRQAVLSLVTAAAVLRGEMVVGQSGGREIFLPLDGMLGITVAYRGRRITIPSDAIMAALSGGKD
jgi:hypothetical protein